MSNCSSWRTALHEEDTIGRSSCFRFHIPSNIGFFLKPRKNIFSFISFKINSTKYAQKGFLMMFALKNQKSLALLFCFPFQMQEVYHVEFEEYFRRILLNMNLSFGDFFFFNQAICYSLLCFKFICIKMHSTFTFWFIVDLYTKQRFPNLSTAS